MFKKLVKMIAGIKVEADRHDAWTEIEKAYQAGKISWDDHETLYTLASMVKVEE